MNKELNKELDREYDTIKGFMKDEILKRNLELVLILTELQATELEDDTVIERFEMGVIFLKDEEGNYYKIQVRNDMSKICSWKNINQIVVKQVDALDIREVGGWKRQRWDSDYQELAFYDYYRPKGNGKHLVKLEKEGTKSVSCLYFGIEQDKSGLHLRCYPWSMTNQEKGKSRKLKEAAVEAMAKERGLRCAFIHSFIL